MGIVQCFNLALGSIKIIPNRHEVFQSDGHFVAISFRVIFVHKRHDKLKRRKEALLPGL